MQFKIFFFIQTETSDMASNTKDSIMNVSRLVNLNIFYCLI